MAAPFSYSHNGERSMVLVYIIITNILVWEKNVKGSAFESLK